MNEASVSSYDEIQYESKPLYTTHPDCLGVAGRLWGLKAASPRQCRLLELGCATGGNLVPMAYALPESQFVGIDLSAAQIAVGQESCRRLNLANIELRAASILDVDETWGQFDYITCHGVYSWVPPAVQERILWICRHLLAPHGVAYVSYNTYPGWHMRGMVRDLMKYHASRFDEPAVRVAQARAVLQFMASATEGIDGSLSRFLTSESEVLANAPDYYLFHEHLEEVNSPIYFHQFVARARGAGLQYLGEAWHHTQLESFPPQVQEALQSLSQDLVDLEQFVDFLKNRTFRCTLLCHGERELVRTPRPDVMEPFSYSALAQPISATPEIRTTGEEKFRLDNGTTATTNHPLLKAALIALFEAWPSAIPFNALFGEAMARSGFASDVQRADRATLGALLLRAYLGNVVAVHIDKFPFQRQVSPRPRASELARLTAETSARVPNLRHRLVVLNGIDRAVLRAADGARSADQIATILREAPPAAGAEAHAFPSDPAAALQCVQEALDRLARGSLLVA